MAADGSSGIVYLVGAGPGDPGLITRRGAALLASCDVVIYDGLVHPSLLDLVPDAAERIYAGKKRSALGPPLTQDAIDRLLVERGRAGLRVVRLKGGDPFVFGRGAEEGRTLAEAGVRFEVVPGVTSATAVTAYAGIPLTVRGAASTVAFATGHEAAGKPTSDVDWQALARMGTVVLFMAWRTVADCCARLVAAGRDPATPAAAVYWGTTAAQRTVTSTLGGLPDAIARAALKPPVLLVVGEVVARREHLAWYENRPLFGVRVLVTRDAARAAPFAAAVAELGGETCAMPVTRIAAPEAADAGPLRTALDRIGRLGQARRSARAARAASTGPSATPGLATPGPAAPDPDAGAPEPYDWILFTSANSVERWFAELAARGLDARALAGARVACVGPATARACAVRGVIADVVPPHGDGAGVARAIIEVDSGSPAHVEVDSGSPVPRAAGEPGPIAGRVLFPRAREGRDEAVRVLRVAGYEVDVAAVYRTAYVGPDDSTIASGLRRLRDGTVDVIAFFAPSQVRALFRVLGDDAARRVASCSVVAAIGDTTRRALTERGVEVHVVPSSPDARVLAAEIAAYHARAPA